MAVLGLFLLAAGIVWGVKEQAAVSAWTVKPRNLEEADVIWEKGSSIRGKEKLEELLTGAEDAAGRQIRLAVKLSQDEEKYAVKTLSAEADGYCYRYWNGASVTEETYRYFLSIEAAGQTGREYYVLSQTELNYRELYRMMWRMPEEREEKFRVILWTGEPETENRFDIGEIPREYREEALVLLGADEMPLFWGNREETGEGVLRVELPEGFSGGMDGWNRFLDKVKQGESARIRVITEEGTKRRTLDLYYSGDCFDVYRNGAVGWSKEYRYLWERPSFGSYPTSIWYLSEEPETELESLRSGYNYEGGFYRTDALRLFEIREEKK